MFIETLFLQLSAISLPKKSAVLPPKFNHHFLFPLPSNPIFLFQFFYRQIFNQNFFSPIELALSYWRTTVSISVVRENYCTFFTFSTTFLKSNPLTFSTLPRITLIQCCAPVSFILLLFSLANSVFPFC